MDPAEISSPLSPLTDSFDRTVYCDALSDVSGEPNETLDIDKNPRESTGNRSTLMQSELDECFALLSTAQRVLECAKLVMTDGKGEHKKFQPPTQSPVSSDLGEEIRGFWTQQSAVVPSLTSMRQSLVSQFPQIQAEILVAISRHDFNPEDLHKLGSPKITGVTELRLLPWTYMRWIRRRLDEDGGVVDKYPLVESVTVPLQAYFQVLVAVSALSDNVSTVRDISKAFFIYNAHLLKLNRIHGWSKVLHYHLDFHRARLVEMQTANYNGWALPDKHLMEEHFDDLLFLRRRVTSRVSLLAAIAFFICCFVFLSLLEIATMHSECVLTSHLNL